MLKLPGTALDLALAAINHHGYGDLFPEELGIVRLHWTDFRSYLADLDLDTYAGYDRIVAFAPKSRLNIRRVALLHPFDLLFFTALVLALRDDITVARLPPHENRVFSYRAEGAAPDILYNEEPSYVHFKERVAEKIASALKLLSESPT